MLDLLYFYCKTCHEGIKKPFYCCKKGFLKMPWMTVQNPPRFVDELIEISGFSKILGREDAPMDIPEGVTRLFRAI